MYIPIVMPMVRHLTYGIHWRNFIPICFQHDEGIEGKRAGKTLMNLEILLNLEVKGVQGIYTEHLDQVPIPLFFAHRQGGSCTHIGMVESTVTKENQTNNQL